MIECKFFGGCWIMWLLVTCFDNWFHYPRVYSILITIVDCNFPVLKERKKVGCNLRALRPKQTSKQDTRYMDSLQVQLVCTVVSERHFKKINDREMICRADSGLGLAGFPYLTYHNQLD